MHITTTIHGFQTTFFVENYGDFLILYSKLLSEKFPEEYFVR